MGLLKRLAGGEMPKPPEQAVIVAFHFQPVSDLQPVFDLESALEDAIAQASAGEFDGNEVSVDGGAHALYMYGPDADRLFAAVQPVLDACPFMQGATVTLRYGPPAGETRERQVVIGA